MVGQATSIWYAGNKKLQLLSYPYKHSLKTFSPILSLADPFFTPIPSSRLQA